MGALHIQSFGDFSITAGDQTLLGASARNSKVASLLKCLFAHRRNSVASERLIDLLWPDEDLADPEKSLRDIVYRARKLLSRSSEKSSFILFGNNRYSWNPNEPCSSDADQFESLIEKAHNRHIGIKERVELYNQAVSLYRGPFLNGGDGEPWAVGFANYYRRLFLQAVSQLSDIYEQDLDLDAVILLADRAIESEPGEESLYMRQIKALIVNGEYTTAIRQHRRIEQIFEREFGAKPSEEMRLLLEEARKCMDEKPDSFSDIKTSLDRMELKKGAVFCNYATFQEIYRLDKRAEERLKFPIFLALITLRPITGDAEGEIAVKAAMKSLRQVLLRTMRRGDVISQHSKCQFVLMLTARNEANGLAALRRIHYLFELSFGKNRVSFSYQLSPASEGSMENIGVERCEDSRGTG